MFDVLEGIMKRRPAIQKISTLRTSGKNIFQGQLTIGLDLGDRSSAYCILNEAGEIVLEHKLATTPETMKQVFGSLPRCRIAMETGTSSGEWSTTRGGHTRRWAIGRLRRRRSRREWRLSGRLRLPTIRHSQTLFSQRLCYKLSHSPWYKNSIRSESDLTRVESQVDLILDNAAMQGKPQTISADLDLASDLVSGGMFGDAESAVADLDRSYGKTHTAAKSATTEQNG
jgi:hypothetical protein